MSTSNRMLLFESAMASLAVLVVVGLSSPADFGVPELGVHPAWLPITLFAARYGARGLCVSAVVITAPLLLAGLFVADSSAALLARAHNPSDVFLLLTAVAAGWIGMSQDNRVRRISRQLDLAREGQERSETTVDELSRTLEILRARCDRMDTSLTVWRSLANRLERGTPVDAAHAALELCALRCSAAAGVIQSVRGEDAPSIVARRGAWTFATPRPQDIAADRTVRAATETGRLICASDVEGAAESDSDVAVPIFDEDDGRLLGVIALRGVDPTDLRAAEIRDLILIAEWLSAPLVRLSTKPRLRAVQEEVQG